MGAVTGPVTDTSVKQIAATTIKQLLDQYFANTLGKENDIVRLIMGLIQKESSFNYNATGPVLSVSASSGASDYYYSSPISNVYTTGNSVQRSNIVQGQQALGLMQTMGWNQVKGASKNGKQLIESVRPDLVSTLCINPGESLYSKFTGQNTVSNQILAGLAILESKYKAVKQSGSKFTIGAGQNQFTYDSKMQCALQGYIGLSKTDKGNGSSTAAYVASIYYGDSFKSANGGGGTTISGPPSTNTGPITAASGDNQHPPGC